MRARTHLIAGALACAVVLTACGGDPCASDSEFFSPGPAIVTEDLPPATVGVPYRADIEVDLLGTLRSDDYNYRFEVDGDLPPGLEALQAGAERWLQIAGTPLAAGSFGFHVIASVDEPRWERIVFPSMCWYSAGRRFHIDVGAR